MTSIPTFATRPTFLGLERSNADAAICIAGIPFDIGTSNRSGARFGPAAIRQASRMLVDGAHPVHWIDPAALPLADIGDFDLALGDIPASLARIEEAANGLEGYERILIQNFDLVIVDINMPKMDGYTMIRAVRGDPAVRRLPAVFVSTEAGEKDAILAYEAGANFYLVKPVVPADLTEVARLMTGVVGP